MTLPATSASAAGGASLSARVTEQSAAGLTVEVEGEGFPVEGEADGVYVGIGESARAATATAGDLVGVDVISSATLADAEGTFTATVALKPAEIASLDPGTSYSVITVRAHTPGSTGEYRAATPIDLDFEALGLVSPEPEPEPEPGPEPDPEPEPGTAASISAVVTGQSPSALSVQVDGSNFPSADPGLYVGVTESDRFSATDAARYRGVKFLSPGMLAADGSFAQTLELDADDIATLDPQRSYSVFTWLAHGAPDPDGDYQTSAALDLDFAALGLIEPAETGKVTAGSITWGLRESFRTYVSRIGSITTKSPATKSADHVVTYPQASGIWTDEVKVVAAQGRVNYAGHGGSLDLHFSEPELTVTGKAGVLSFNIKDSAGVDHEAVPFANVTLTSVYISESDKAITIAGAPTRLTTQGADVMNGYYDAGAELDPLTAVFALDSAEVPATPKPKPPKKNKDNKNKKKDKSDKKNEATPRAGQAGALSWGVKASFRSYITGPIANGAVSVSGGASAAGGVYRFGQASTTATPPSAVGSTEYRGAVRFHGHHGELDLTLSQPRVRVTSASSGMLSAAVPGRGRVDVAVVELNRASRTTASNWVQYAGAQAALTPAGAALFSRDGNNFYPAGTVVDPVTFSVGSTASASGGGGVVAAADTTSNWTPPATPPSTTGLTVDADDVKAGDEITATASGFTPNETGIRVVLYSVPMILAQDVVADASGTATWTGVIPATVAAGEHTLTFQGSVDRGAVLDIGAAEAIAGCTISDGRLDWGFKESFRAYVSGSIANGDWTTRGNASYATPQFTWSQGEGVRDEATGAGSLEFTGAINFTGHGGSLDTVIENPVIMFTDEKTAALSVDYTGGSMDAAMAGEDDRRTIVAVPFADLDLAAGTTTADGSTVTIADIPTALTSAGSAAFPNYPAGSALDPITLTFTVADPCDAAAAPAPASGAAASVAAAAPAPAADDLPVWLPWIGGALLGALAAVGGTVLVMRRRFPGTGA